MADDYKTPRKWSLEEIDELLQDSGMLPRDDNSLEAVEEVAPTPKEAPFNPRPLRNDKIKHRIISEKVEKSDGVAEPQVYGSFVSEKYREKFFNKPVQNIAKTAEHTIVLPEDQKFERGGFVKAKSNFSKTADFMPVPHLVPDDKVSVDVGGKTIVFDDEIHQKTIALRSLAVTDGDAHDIELPIDEDDPQLALEGFHTVEDIEQVDEALVEAELLEKRKQKVSSFAITSEITESANEEGKKLYGTDEYRTADDKFKVKYFLKKKKSAAFLGMISSYICVALLTVVSVLGVKNPQLSTLVIVLNTILILVAGGINFSAVLDGIKSFKGLKFNSNSGLFIGLAVTLLQGVVLLLCENPFETGVCLFGGAAVLPLGFNMTGEYLEYKRIYDNFEYISSDRELFSVNYIDKKETAFEIGRGLLLDEPSVISSQKTLFPRRFIELSRKSYPSESINRKLIPLGVGASLLVGALTLLITKDIRSAISAMCGSMCISLPYFSVITEIIAIRKVSSRLLKKGAMLSGWSALDLCEDANAVVVDSGDIFDKNGGDVFGIHPFYGMSADEAIIYTATLTIASGGPVGNLFKRVIVGETSLLPPVDTLTYEDKLGLSAWIFNRRILVGSEDLLRNHNVEIPDGALIKKHLKPGRYPLYLAIDGKAAAVFIISYDIDPKNARLLKAIENNSISLLVKSDDANITDEMVAAGLMLPKSGIKVISAVSGEIYKSYIKETATAADSYLIHDGKAQSFLYAVEGALSLGSFKNIIKTLQACACGIGIAVVGALSFVSGLQGFSCISLLLLQALFAGASVAIVSGGHAFKNRKKKK